MKTNFPFPAFLVWLLLSTRIVLGSPAAEMSFAFPDECAEVGRDGKLYFSPVHPGVALGEAPSLEMYPCVNASLAGDLCGLDGSQVSSRGIRRRSDYLSVELAEVTHKHGAPVQAAFNPIPALLLLFLLCSRTQRIPA